MPNKKTLGLSILCLFAAASAFAYGGSVAIAYNPQTNTVGVDHGASSPALAQENALSVCGAGCTVLNTTEDGWVAVARNAAGNYGTAGVHDTQADAQQSALDNCERSAANHGVAAGGCYVRRSTSSFYNYPDLDGVDNR